jgi:outer membrane protein assembly factor BamD (BamD/ComL family)
MRHVSEWESCAEHPSFEKHSKSMEAIMKLKDYRIILSGVFCALLLFACAMSESYKLGQDLAREGRWEEAVVYFEKAISESPDNREYRDALKNAKEEVARTAYEKTQRSRAAEAEKLQARLKSLYAGAEADMQKEDWPAAVEKLRQINKITPNYEDTSIRLAKAEQESIKTLYQQGLALGRQEEWKLAAQVFKSLMEINPNYYDVAKLY